MEAAESTETAAEKTSEDKVKAYDNVVGSYSFRVR